MYETQLSAINEHFRLLFDNHEGQEQAVLAIIGDCEAAMEREQEG
jgi:hypothetical protein